MTTVAVNVLLTLTVLCVWLGCAGFVRLHHPLDRLHCVAFINVTAFLMLTLAGFIADGVSPRSIKIAMIAILMLIGSAAGTHVTGRALLRRGSS